MEDRQILDLYWQRSEDAVRETERKYGGYCRTVAGRLLADRMDVEECVSDTWLKAWMAIPPHRPNRLQLFLGKLARTRACDMLRAQTARKRGGGACLLALEELGECVPAAPGADRAVEERELTELLNRFLRELPERDCNVFLRRYWYAEPLEDIARRYGMKVNTVKTRLFRLRGRLRDYLEKEGILL